MSDTTTGRPAEDQRIAVSREVLAEVEACAETPGYNYAYMHGQLRAVARNLLAVIDERAARDDAVARGVERAGERP